MCQPQPLQVGSGFLTGLFKKSVSVMQKEVKYLNYRLRDPSILIRLQS